MSGSVPEGTAAVTFGMKDGQPKKLTVSKVVHSARRSSRCHPFSLRLGVNPFLFSFFFYSFSSFFYIDIYCSVLLMLLPRLTSWFPRL